MFETALIAVFVAITLYVAIPQIRYHFRMLRGRNWPVTGGTAQKGEVLHSGATKFQQFLPFRALLGYAYTVNGASYFGEFVLAAEDMQTAEKLQKQVDGRAVSVQYDPKNPEISFLVDRELLGRRVVQDPYWLDS